VAQRPAIDDLLHAAVSGVGGVERPGQVAMARAVAEAVEKGEHLLVQAGTGTGKSLAYLVPAVAHAFDTGKPAVVATATLALQAQIVDRDMPRVADALAPLLGRRPTYALVKGRRNYVCLNKLEGGFPDEEEGLLSVGQVDATVGRLGAEVVRLREWAGHTESGDRDELVPGVSERAWRQVSVSAHECLGGRCPFVADCFVERAREAAKDVDVVVTNHSFMAIDSFEGRQMLPEHEVLVVDEAHELVDRVTATITDELTGSMVATAAKRAGRMSENTPELAEAGEMLAAALERVEEGRMLGVPDAVGLALARVRDTARQVQSDLKPPPGTEVDGARQVARAAVDEVHENAGRVLEERELDVVWLSHDPRRGPVLRVAPMSVAALVREKVFDDRTLVLTSATLELGGTFDAVAGTIGLRGDGAPAWRGLDVGSPFDYPKQAIAYVAAHLPPPGRDGTSEAALDEIEQLVRAAGGRTLGLFSSTRAAQHAAEVMRARLGEEFPVLCQGEDQITTLVRQFARSARTCLFGTLTLWQGVDVPGSSCQLVIIDRIPFPRPDDPLASARSQAIARMGGNGFMAVSATHAALRLAQGAGRLVRRSDDRGVVAFLDSRMMTARYAGFLQRSLPPFYPTTDKQMVLAALGRLDEMAPEPLQVEEPALRSLNGSRADDGSEHPRPVAAPPPVPAAPRSAVTSGHAWTDEQDAELRDAAEAGMLLDELVDHFELPGEAISTRAGQLGLTLATGQLFD
jgi:ATP-dependent DNA helicase DinG